MDLFTEWPTKTMNHLSASGNIKSFSHYHKLTRQKLTHTKLDNFLCRNHSVFHIKSPKTFSVISYTRSLLKPQNLVYIFGRKNSTSYRFSSYAILDRNGGKNASPIKWVISNFARNGQRECIQKIKWTNIMYFKLKRGQNISFFVILKPQLYFCLLYFCCVIISWIRF